MFFYFLVPLIAFFAVLNGQEVLPVTADKLHQQVVAPGAKVVLVNMWATWCLPCRKEMPDIVKLAHSYQDKGLRVLLVSNDDASQLDAVKKFLTECGADFPTYIKAEKDDAFINQVDPKWSGALPATFIYDSSGRLIDYWEGAKSYEDFETKITPFLKIGAQK
ncbi:MAG: TlpA family protein disulfide reductase [Verrucomicrobia bacterium]|nr:TlpA family protein disulfide reductase [Verrucomicrobiota bacterium]